ncbi:GTPase activating protein (Gyp5) [Rasamsonia emersonii CBS 393.64]|uniref:GTPase-activating protein GYP5 n=1 Tax=Rasamsonia emersonii (strain ATCC 16479 / CBS 393.64 / IMI 116815) TaxID=1408163 RepID=A0A0F4YI49_RASE3|nr:GTPase activating protein (Gyp5) [Rasamsonia emersonii CBS 393.64]KKA17889.1 GTPase activating protein (Gyp5) [Rasamsonia emersonii CBS 393.64]
MRYASPFASLLSDSAHGPGEQETFEDASELKGDEGPSISHSSSTRSLTGRRPSNGSVTTPRAGDSPSLPSAPLDGKNNNEETDDTSSAPHSETEDTPRKKKFQKSPLLTAHRLSTTSLDDVNLPRPRISRRFPVVSVPRVDFETNYAFEWIHCQYAFVPWSSAPSKPSTSSAAPPPPPAPSRKLTSPFSWLSRSTASKDVKSPPSQPADSRRNTAASVSTLNSTSEALGRLQEGDETDSMSVGSKKPGRNSLKDQFKLLRMRDEGVISDNDQASVASGRASVSHGIGSPPSIAEEQEAGLPVSPPITTASIASSNLPTNPNLAPGTVSGIAASPSDAAAPVDWELWQQLVNHGPEALTGANSAELNAAIRKGIPQTIRGVIWQVLADSRNPELEELYRELVARGTDKEKDRHGSINGQANGTDREKESLSSSRSSVRSDQSGSGALANGTGSSSPAQEKDAEKLAKEQAAIEAARKKKAKEDAEMIRKLEKAIRRDLGSRTSYSKYFISQGNQEALFGLCKAYALYDEAVGYAQGINFIAMPLLFNMDEAEAFTLLVKLMNKYGLREMFIQDMPGLHLHLYQFERLLEDLEPALYCHLRRRGVTPQLYATQWFLTLFAYRFPLQLVLRIYDLIFDEGLESTILRFGVAIMRRNAETLLGMKDMSTLSTFLKEKLFDVYIDQQPSASSILESGFFGSSGGDKEVYRADVMVQDACAIPLTQEMIKQYTAEWEEKVRIEKEREAELEGLRHTVAVQAARIRSLEEHAEKSDKEHVQLASELVRLKVENEELQDMNESLRIQVQELKNVVDKQPAEVEEKLRTEMERIMKRNLEVQNENRSMEEQMAEMEKDLVETKMKWAELSENHEALKQKWADLRRALD